MLTAEKLMDMGNLIAGGMINFEDIPFPNDFTLKERSLVAMIPEEMGGNHKHPRTECFLVFGGNLEFIWLDKNGKKQVESMTSKDNLLLFVVPPFLSHAVVNKSETETAYLLEFADMELRDFERVEVI